MEDNLIAVNVTVDNITQNYRLLRRFNAETDKLTEITVIGNQKAIPDSTATVMYEDLPLGGFIAEKVPEWDGNTPLTLYFNDEGHFDHWEKTGTAGAAA